MISSPERNPAPPRGVLLAIVAVSVAVVVSAGPWAGSPAVAEAGTAPETYITWQSQTVLPDLESAYGTVITGAGLRAYFTDEQVTIVPLAGSAPAWVASVKLAGVRGAGLATPLGAAGVRIERNRVEYPRAGEITEWYANDGQRLTLGVTLGGREPGARGVLQRGLRLDWELSGGLSAKTAVAGAGLDLLAETGGRAMEMSLIRATDADGRDLLSRLVEGGRNERRSVFGLELDATDAVFPVFVELALASVAQGPTAVAPAGAAGVPQVRLDPDGGLSSGGGVGGLAGGASPVVSTVTPPPNDRCDGAEAIPAPGPFPWLTSLIADVSDAATQADPPLPGCQPSVSRSVWYTFTPEVGGNYSISSCADAPTGTTLDDTVIAVYSSGGGCAGPFTEVATGCATDGCDDDGCLTEARQAVLRTDLVAGTQYYIVVWQYGTTAPAAGNTALQLRVTRNAPSGALCADAPEVFLDAPVTGSTVQAGNDHELPPSAGCFTGIGQTSSIAGGNDTVYRFTAPSAGAYSFKVSNYDMLNNLVLYAADACPAGPPPTQVTGCLGAANRFTLTTSEEVMCLPLAAGQQVYLFVDEDACTFGSAAFTLEANRFAREAEPNGTPASAQDLSCGLEGAVSPAGDADFFHLGAPVSGSRVFAAVDGVAGNSTDFDMRLTTSADTLEYDDLDQDIIFGNLSPNLSGARASGAPVYLRVNHYSAVTQAEPYRLYAAVQPPSAQASPEVEPNDATAQANSAPNDYFSGTLSSTTDVDLFAFTAQAGEILTLGLDGDPLRNNTPINPALALLDALGTELTAVNDGNNVSSVGAGTGNLNAFSPRSPGEALIYRIRTTGTYYARVAMSFNSTVIGDYLLSVARDCKVVPGTDVTLNMAASPTCVTSGATIVYTLSVGNAGGATARNVVLVDPLPAGVSYVSAVASQGSCTGSSVVRCNLGDMAASGAATVTITVTASTDGVIVNSARVATDVRDTAPANNSASVTNNGGCNDGDACTTQDACSAGACVGGPPLDCNDLNICTDDSCAPATGCVNAANTLPCDDGSRCTTADQCAGGNCVGGPPPNCNDENSCTDDACVPAAGCIHTDNDDPCEDGNACTTLDRCSVGGCIGGPPPDCNDGNLCTDDSCNTATGCVNAFNNVPCNDGIACTNFDQCQAGACAGHNTCCESPAPKTHGYYLRVCRGHERDDQITQEDVDCVNNSCSFASVQSIGGLCARFEAGQGGTRCAKADAELMALLINNCRYRACDENIIDSRCSTNTTVSQSLGQVDTLLCNPSRSVPDCEQARCLAGEINSGRALRTNSHRVQQSAESGAGGQQTITLTWEASLNEPAGLLYRIWRRPVGSESSYVMIAEVPGFTFVDQPPPPGDYEYDVTGMRPTP